LVLKPLDGAHAAGARIILTARNPEGLQRAAKEIDALSTAAFDATDQALKAVLRRPLGARIFDTCFTNDSLLAAMFEITRPFKCC
jgi:NADP-dependent 3-hydroxy acid dehydrogenase YdfG